MEDPGEDFPERATRGDAFGEMIRAAYRREAAVGVIERDDGLVEPHDPRIYLAPPHEWQSLDHAACDRAMGRVLDVGCGAGRHAVYLQAKGYQVTGIDTSSGAVITAKERGLRDAHELDVEHVDTLDGRFDTILMLGGNLGLLGSPQQAIRILNALAEIAASGARVLAHGLDPYDTAEPGHLEYHARNRARGRMPGQVRCRPRFRRLVGPWTGLLHCSVDELSTLVASSPWQVGNSRAFQNNYLVELNLR